MSSAYVSGILMSVPATFVICYASDFLCQRMEIYVADHKRTMALLGGAKDDGVPAEKLYNHRRTLTFAGVGGAIFGPLSYSRYAILDFLLPDGNGVLYVLGKTAASSLVYTPLMTAIGIVSNDYLSPNGTWNSAFAKVRNEFWKILLVGYVFKVFTTLFCMSFPGTNTKFWVSQLVGMVQNIFTSWRIYAQLEDVQTQEKSKGLYAEAPEGDDAVARQ